MNTENIIKTQNNILTDSGYKKIYSETSSDLVIREEKNETVESSILDIESDIEDLFDNKSPIIHNHTTNDISDFPSSLPALDVYDWAKQPEKPHYTASEVDALPLDTTIPSKTSELINDSGFLTSIPEEYITATELSEKGYLTEHQDISDFARKDDLHTHENKTVLDIITDEKISEWNNKSNFSGNYSDLVGTPIIPSITGLATTEYVDNALTEELNRATTAESNHNTSITAHSDIRELISELTTRLNALADSDDTTLDQLSEIIVYIKSNRTLIENVTTNKVNVSDIVDNLTSTSPDKILSAKQGKVLNDLIIALTSVVDTKVDKVDGMGLSTNDYTTAEKTKLDSIATGAEVNQNAFSNVVVDTTTITAGSQTDTITLSAGDNTTLTTDTINDKITISSAHPSITKSTDSASTASPSAGETFTAIDSVIRDTYGHVTKVNTKTITLPNTSITIDSALSSTSINPVENKVINTELAKKQEVITGAATSVVTNNLTANRAMTTDSYGKVGVSPVTSTQLGYLSGATSNIQTQINNIQSQLINSTPKFNILTISTASTPTATDTVLINTGVLSSGIYIVNAQVQFATNSTGNRETGIYNLSTSGTLGGTGIFHRQSAISGGATIINISGVTTIGENYRLAVKAKQSSGTTININGYFTYCKIG